MNAVSSTNSLAQGLNNLTANGVTPQQLKQEDFLKLMMAQIRVQNPLEPQDSNAMLQQISQLSTLSTNESLQKSIGQLTENLSATQAL